MPPPPKISEDGDKNVLKCLREGSQCTPTSYNFMNHPPPPILQYKTFSAATVAIGQVLCPLKLYFVMNAEENRHLVYIPGFPPAAFDPAVFDPAAFDPAASS